MFARTATAHIINYPRVYRYEETLDIYDDIN